MFWQNLKESNITQLTLTVIIWGTLSVMTVSGSHVPEWLIGAGLAILGYFFGMKANRGQLDNIRKMFYDTLEKDNPGKDNQ